MDLTPQDLWTLRNIIIRAVNESHEVLAAAARRSKQDQKRDARGAEALPPVQAPALAPKPPGREQPPKLAYTLNEASVALGLSKSTLYKMIADGRLVTLRLGSRRLIETKTIEAVLAAARE